MLRKLNLCYSHKFARYVSGFLLPGIRKKLPVAGSVGDLRSQKTPRGILPVNSNQHFLLLPATCNLSVNYVILLATGKKFN